MRLKATLLALVALCATIIPASAQTFGISDVGRYTYATLPAKVAGRIAFCTDCLKPNVVYGQQTTGTVVTTDGINWFNGEGPQANPSLATHTGLVATNTSFPQVVGSPTTFKSVMSRTRHAMMENVTSLQVIFGNMAGNSELAPGATTSIKASIEFPDGTETALLFSGSTTGTIPNGGTLTSDSLTITIRRGESIWVRQFLNNTVTIGYSVTGDSVNGEGGEFFTTVNAGTDKTTSGTVTANSNVVYPMAIIGATTRNGICLAGDSRTYTQVDSPIYGQQSDSGLIPRSLAEYYAYTSLHYPAETAQMAVATHTIKNNIAAYCTHFISEYGIVDLGGTARTSTQLLTDQQSISGWPNVTGKPFTLVTLAPWTTSTDNWATIANQTVVSNSAQITSYNTTLRTSQPSWTASVIDEAYFMESSQNSGKWKADGTANKYTPDGLHYSGYAVQNARDRDEVDLSYFGWSQNIAPGTVRANMLSNGASALSQLNGPAVFPSIGLGSTGAPGTLARLRATDCPQYTNNTAVGACVVVGGKDGSARAGCLVLSDQTDASGWCITNNTGPLVFYRISGGLGTSSAIATQSLTIQTGGQLSLSHNMGYAGGTASEAPLTMAPGTLLTTATAGAIEMDTNAFYTTVNNGRGVMPSEQKAILSANYTLTSQTAAQKLLNASANGAVTLPTGAFEFECNFALASMSSTSGSFGFALGGTATKTEGWQARAAKIATPVSTATTEQVSWNTAANTAIATASTATTGTALIKGTIRITVAGTIIPQVSLGVAAAAVVQTNSYCKFSPFGSSSATTVGNWS